MKINGKVSRDIYQTPRLPKVYNPVFDDHLASRIPKEVMKMIPPDVLLVFLMEYEGDEQRVYHVTYHDGKRWFTAANLFDYRKRKWMDGRTTRLYGEQFRADLEHQWWTREGYEKAKADNRLDPQVAAVWSNYVKFYGRDEALCRLGLPPVSTGYNERHFEECAKYGWYFERESNPPVQPRRGNRRRTIG
ncbi:hypothetical protein GZH47_31750 (plasmid) [Paenibacillus rhizovicinus]|uniref:Uncharacterized protein n=1 Tax=Paenibacillus rhizovicinus TaxID=2704463 RepID=A0A6C0PCW0_9BACL|nr:hypothetical protein [Paenibacillus rhizovicinus]QHW35472.1 hypothetical protein GZH47_31750 [Paenibacillus rhizovicinus]